MGFFKALIYTFIYTLLFGSSVWVQASDTKDENTTGVKKPATPVIITHVEMYEFSDKVEALGTLRANESVNLTPSITEIVTQISFEDNQRVHKGDVLASMNIAEELAELTEQESFSKEAQRQINRLSPLVKQGAASASALDESKRELEGAKARINAIQSRIDQHVIKAPFDGILGLRNISIGALVQPGLLITTIDDDGIMKLDFSVPEIFLATLKPGIIIEAETEAYPDKIFKGRISNVDSRIDSVTRSIRARALIDNEQGLLKPGLLMKVELQKNPRQSLLVPEEALVADGPDNFVFVVTSSATKKNNRKHAERRKVEIGTRQYGKAEIIKGLEQGDQIVTHGTLRIRDGAEIEITAIEKNNEPLAKLLKQKKEQVKPKEVSQ